MPEHDQLTSIEQQIRGWLAAGRPFDGGVRHYIEQALGSPDTEELRDLILDDSHPDHDAFMEFLVFPDMELHHALEPYLTQAISDSALDALTARIKAKRPVTALICENATRIPFELPVWCIADMLARLHLRLQLPPALLETLDRRMCAEQRISARIAIRVSRVRLEGIHFSLLMDLLQGTPCTAPDFPACLSLWLGFLRSLAENTDPWQTLVEQRRKLHTAIREHSEFQEKLKRFNMETLMMQGNRAPFIDVDETRKTIRMMDRISLAVFGKPAAHEEELREISLGSINLGTADTADDPAKNTEEAVNAVLRLLDTL